MTRKEFVEQLKETVKAELADKGYEVSLVNVNKVSEAYLGLNVKKDGTMASPVYNMDKAWLEYMKTEDLEGIAEEIIKMTMKNDVTIDFDFSNYEAVKDRLFVRASNIESNGGFLKNVPFRKTCDLALTCHIDFGKKGHTMMSAVITKDMLKRFGVTEDQLLDDAIGNTKKTKPAMIKTLYGTVCELSGQDYDAAADVPVFVLTNRETIFGAPVLFYDGVMEMIGKKLGNFYVLPSSVHETLIMRDDGQDAKSLAEMVRSVNRSEVKPEERLSDHVYHYDCETGKLTVAA